MAQADDIGERWKRAALDEGANKVETGRDEGASRVDTPGGFAPAADGWFGGKGEPEGSHAASRGVPHAATPAAVPVPEVLAFPRPARAPLTAGASSDACPGAASTADGGEEGAASDGVPSAAASSVTAAPDAAACGGSSPSPSRRRKGVVARLAALLGRGASGGREAAEGPRRQGAASPSDGSASMCASSADVSAVPGGACPCGTCGDALSQDPSVPACAVLPDGSVSLPQGASVEVLPSLVAPRGDGDGREGEAATYALLRRGLPLPPGGGAYLLEIARPSADPAPAAEKTATIVAYIDAYGRAFSAGGVQTMPPARTPDVRLVGFAKATPGAGFVEVALSRTKTARVVEYSEAPDGTLSFTGVREGLGLESAGLDPTDACAVAFLAFWLFPRRAGVSLSSVNVKDLLGRLQSSDLFETVDLFVADARKAEAHPLLVPPGIVGYTARCLSAAGLEHLRASDLAPLSEDEPGGDGAGASVFRVAPVDAADLPTFSDAGEGASDGREGSRDDHVARDGSDLLASIQRALEESGIPGLTLISATGPDGKRVMAPPAVRMVRTAAYARLFYIAFDRGQVSADGAFKLLAAESVLNRFLLMAERLDQLGMAQSASFGQVAELDSWLVDRISDLAAPYLDDTVAGIERSETGSVDLDARISFARGCEGLRLPYRLEYGFRFDAVAGDLVVDVECPSSGLMPDVVRLAGGGGGAWRERTYAEREGLASRYALHLAALVAAVGFWASGQVERVTVNCWHGMGSARGVDELAPLGGGLVRGPVMGEPACVATVQFGRAWFARSLATPDQRAALADDPFAFIAPVHHSYALDADGHLGRVRPLYDTDDPRLHPQGADVQPEFDDRPLTVRGSELLRASFVSDLAIYENAARRRAAEEVAEAFAAHGTEGALAALKDVHDRIENPLFREACMRVRQGIEDGSYTAGSKGAIVEALGDIYGLQVGSRNAYRLLHKDPEGTRRRVEAMIDGIDERVLFADTATRRYRYFDSYASRALYAARCDEADDGRELRLCADEYYLCHYRLASLLADSLDHGEDAIAHARRCVELAPSVAAGYLRLARCYFCVFDYLSEIDTLKQMLRIAWSPTDVGLALYWLGYAFCLTDRRDVGLACYQRCVEYDRSLTEIAATEAVDFLQRYGEKPRALGDREVEALLAREGIDLGQVARNADFLVQAAGALADVEAYGFARNLLGAAEATLRDDAMPPVFESLEE